MRFALSEDQTLLQDSLNRTLADLVPLDRVRRFADGGDTAEASDIWMRLAEMGLPGLMIPEEHGGLGLGMLEAALAAEALGRVVAPTPFLGSAVLAPLALKLGGTEAQQRRWLPKLATGAATAGIAISEPIAGARDGAGVTAKDGRLTGQALFALDATGADLLIVADTAGGLHLANIAEAAEPMPGIDATRRLKALTFKDTPAEALTSNPALDRLRDAAWILLAADTLGAAQVMLERAVAYAKERKQFGRTIGSFQAVKHLCAEMAAELEPARALVWYAAYAFDNTPDEAPLMAAHAKAHTSEIGRFIARTATEVHGGIGITDLLGLHYWFKRIGQNRQLLGGPERVREIAARIQGLVA
ncbi:MAG: acyl-CoA/acyl-ACP dehydrogenase [Alphaproteobacteria bacterium]|nr:acyl-CoA/acyl-ACP dehydrogenase [Alphaproteobacteria bacterium]MBU1515864.1 acyl-CoA/acyl-ACP dehydrogenase [Alphaproteobacteria bacterium]MBU2094086.1 acyl-CoA/acyl-ACP dehydrogenase [Alphaproteobacteria bacterium]MBU2151438.1 acyl-CoA/acyl-ACP dehydrogenase [Alphaproteobacteria bacterium]MBU2305286.1 acyl-CoA/acyl-ACP dehydrogenase [Alphaproteobacteria bacterium]